MVYGIEIKTYERAYREVVYGAVETCDRVALILNCDNVHAVDVIDLQTGAVMLEIVDNAVEWLDTDLPVRMVDEVFNKNF